MIRIAGCRIIDKNIAIHTANEFAGNYGGYTIYVTTDHGLGKPSSNRLKRFQIEVITIEGNTFVFRDWKDFGCVEKAVMHALKGAGLLKPKARKKYKKRKPK